MNDGDRQKSIVHRLWVPEQALFGALRSRHLVMTIRRDLRAPGHATNPSAEDYRNLQGFGPRCPTQTSTFNQRSARDLRKVEDTRFELVTS